MVWVYRQRVFPPPFLCGLPLWNIEPTALGVEDGDRVAVGNLNDDAFEDAGCGVGL